MRLLAAQKDLPLSYPEAGRTRDGTLPAGYPVNRHRAPIGSGRADFEAAVFAMREWAVYDLPWTQLWPLDARVEVGREVAVLVRHFGFWSLNPCRVVYAEREETEEGERFQLAIGTLPWHAERGEERMRVEWIRATDEVWFDLLAFAAARHPLVRLAHPLMVRLQRRFARQAAQAVAARVREARG